MKHRGLRGLLAGICLAAAIMTYFAGRAVPLILIGFLIYLAVFNRSILRRVWWRYGLALGIAVLIVLPMFIEIANTPGGEKRTEVVGGPLIELRRGNLQPAIETTLGTLGMFTFAGDPEWLYNIENRPVFDWVTGLFFYLGVIICLVRLKRVESGFALVWLFVGIAPAFVSIPAASFSHTIAALPVVYMLAALGIVETVDKLVSRQGNKQLALSTYLLVSLFVVGLGAWLTIRDYFGTWANEYIVRFQYHAPTREVAKWLNQNPQIADVAIGTNPNLLVLDPLALRLDLNRRNVEVTWFNPEMAMILSHKGPTIVTSMQLPGETIQSFLRIKGLPVKLDPDRYHDPEFAIYHFARFVGGKPYNVAFGDPTLALVLTYLPPGAIPGHPVRWITVWDTQKTLPPRLKMFLHILDDKNAVIAGNDREDINFATLQPEDTFLQVSQVNLPPDLPSGRYQVEVGWYNPETGERLKRADGSDRYLLPPLEVLAP